MQIAEIDFCGPNDLSALVAIEKACFDDPWEARVIERDLNGQGDALYLKAEFKRDVVAYAVISRGDDICHLMNLAVMPEYRRMGIAQQLMLAVQEVADDWGNRSIRLEVRASNHDARHFYSSLGFAYNSRLKGYYASGEDALVLTAKLPLKIS